MTASVVIAPDADLAAIAAAAGNANPDDRGYYQGALYVRGVMQAALDAAVAQIGTAPLVLVPQSVALWRARAALAQAGLLGAVDAAIAASGAAAAQWWEYGTELERAHPKVAQLGAALGLTSAQIDDLFRAAALIEP